MFLKAQKRDSASAKVKPLENIGWCSCAIHTDCLCKCSQFIANLEGNPFKCKVKLQLNNKLKRFINYE